MAKQETMDVIEKTLDTAEETFETLERIPKVNLNGTTKKQQIIILSTVAGVSAVAGMFVTYTFLKGRLPFRRQKAKISPTISVQG